MAGRLRWNPLPARATALDGALPGVEDQGAVVLVSVLVCDTGLVVTAETKHTRCFAEKSVTSAHSEFSKYINNYTPCWSYLRLAATISSAVEPACHGGGGAPCRQ